MTFSAANGIRLFFILAVVSFCLPPSPADAAASLEGLWKGGLNCDNRRAGPLVLSLSWLGKTGQVGQVEFLPDGVTLKGRS